MPGEPQGMSEIVQAAKRLSRETGFPIRNFGQLLKALGGEQGEFELLGKKHKVSEIRALVPQEYFPIESEEDLAAKIANLEATRPDSPLLKTQLANEEPASPDRKPPKEQDHKRPPKGNEGPSIAVGVE